jgi:solute carrier family 5 (high affinity choline transporter), member 7
LSNKAVKNIYETRDEWLGSIEVTDIGIYIDTMLVLIFGGIPWQVYFQRVLSAKTEKSAMYLSYIAALGCFLAGIPPIIIGAIGKSTGKSLNIL